MNCCLAGTSQKLRGELLNLCIGMPACHRCLRIRTMSGDIPADLALLV